MGKVASTETKRRWISASPGAGAGTARAEGLSPALSLDAKGPTINLELSSAISVPTWERCFENAASPRERMRGWRLESKSQFLVDIGWALFENLGPTQCDSCFVNPYKQKHSFPCLRSFEFLSLAPELILINTQCAGRCCPWFLETATFNKVYSMLLIFFSVYLSNTPQLWFCDWF